VSSNRFQGKVDLAHNPQAICRARYSVVVVTTVQNGEVVDILVDPLERTRMFHACSPIQFVCDMCFTGAYRD